MSRLLITLAVAVLSLLQVCSVTAQTPRNASRADARAKLERQLQQSSEELNKTLPRLINKFSRLDSVFGGPGLSVTHFYTLLSPQSQNANERQVREELGPQILNGLCQTPRMRHLLESGVTFDHIYRNLKGKVVGQIHTAWKDCRDRV